MRQIKEFWESLVEIVGLFFVYTRQLTPEQQAMEDAVRRDLADEKNWG